MVASNREIAKNNFFSLHSAMSPLMNVHIANDDSYMNVEPPRERSNISSGISSRKVSTYFSISSIPYIDRMEI